MTITSTFIIMLNTGCSLDTRKQIISHWLPYGADGRTGGRAEGRKGGRAYGHVTSKISRMHE